MPLISDPSICARCKGSRRLCGLPRCPILERIKSSLNISSRIRDRILYASSPPSILVGEASYPYVFLGPNIAPVVGLSSLEYDSPERWWGVKDINDIIRLRSSLIYSRFRVNVKDARMMRGRLLDVASQIAMSIKPVNVETYYSKIPRPRLRFDGILAPIGLTGRLIKARLTENPVIPRKVDSIVEDKDVKAIEAISELYKSGISFYNILRIFSIGLLGEKRSRKIVPTRWSITAIDNILGNLLLRNVRHFPSINDIMLYYTKYIGNKYIVLLIPGKWSYEMIEIWLPRTIWVKTNKPFFTVNYEKYDGKWRYPGVDGGYHAIRYPLLEYLYRIHRQAIAIVIREVGKEYYAPLGSWQIRESIRNIFKRKYIRLEDIRHALKTIAKLVETDINEIVKNSHLLKEIFVQKKLL